MHCKCKAVVRVVSQKDSTLQVIPTSPSPTTVTVNSPQNTIIDVMSTSHAEVNVSPVKTAKIIAKNLQTAYPLNEILDVKIGTNEEDITSVVENHIATLLTRTMYNASSNKLATMADVPLFESTDVELVEVD